MKPGCVGCFILLVGLTFLAVLAGGFLFLTGNILEEPQREFLNWSPADASMARVKLSEILQRDTGQSGRQDPLVLTEREVTALVARHLAETAGLRFEPFAMSSFSCRKSRVSGSLAAGRCAPPPAGCVTARRS